MVSMPLAVTSPVDWPCKWQAALGSWTTLTPNLFSHINAFFAYLCMTLKGIRSCGQTYIFGETAHNFDICIKEHNDIRHHSLFMSGGRGWQERAGPLKNQEMKWGGGGSFTSIHSFSWDVLATAHSWLTSTIVTTHPVPYGNWS